MKATNPKEAADYTKKGEQTKEEWDKFKTQGPNYGLNADFVERGSIPIAGKRTDLDRFTDDVDNGTRDILSLMRLHKGVMARHRQYCLDYLSLTAPKPAAKPISLVPWQQQCVDLMHQPAHQRKVHVVVDTLGGGGKSTFASYLRATFEGVQVLAPSDTSNLAYLLDVQSRTLVIDVPRSACDKVPWEFIEACKNGNVTSTKYQCITKEFKDPVRVFVFMNSMPDQSKLSADRWDWIIVTEQVINRPLMQVSIVAPTTIDDSVPNLVSLPTSPLVGVPSSSGWFSDLRSKRVCVNPVIAVDSQPGSDTTHLSQQTILDDGQRETPIVISDDECEPDPLDLLLQACLAESQSQ